MSKRIIFTFVWAASFLVASAILLLVTWWVYFAMTGAPARRPSDDTFMWFGASAVIVPLLLGGIGAILGICGILPGTQKSRDESD